MAARPDRRPGGGRYLVRVGQPRALCGFGTIRRCPGPAWHLDMAITLPVGVKAYGAYALGAWQAPGGVPAAARMFARRSAVGSLALGMLGHVIYHLLAAAHAARAAWPVVVLMSYVPVVTLGFGAALMPLLRAPEAHPDVSPNGCAAPEGGAETARMYGVGQRCL